MTNRPYDGESPYRAPQAGTRYVVAILCVLALIGLCDVVEMVMRART